MLTEPSPVALVTGASSGIGQSTARALAARSYRVALVARREDRLRQLVTEIESVGGSAFAIPADLAENVERERVVSAVRERWSRIDVVVNNAGLGWLSEYVKLPAERREAILDVNVAALAHLTHLVLPEMLGRRSGHIVNIGSVAGDVILPTHVLYGASKAFVQAFSHGLSRELRGTGVFVTVVNPGPVRTEFRRVAMGVAVDRQPELESGIPAERVAAAVVDVLRRPCASVYVPRYLQYAPLVELYFGWLIDRFGRQIIPLLSGPN